MNHTLNIMIVQVIEYRLPNGRKIEHDLELPDTCREKYNQLTDLGCCLTAEVLTTDQVSQTIEHEYGDYDITLTEESDLEHNKQMLIKMIMSFDIDNFNTWMKEQKDESPE